MRRQGGLGRPYGSQHSRGGQQSRGRRAGAGTTLISMSEGDGPPSQPSVPSDPLETIAQVHAWRQIADLGGFPHHPSWDEMEADARRRLGVVETPPPEDQTESAAAVALDITDPVLLLAQVKGSRIAADLAGVAHDPSWDVTEQAALRSFHPPEEAPHRGAGTP